MQTVRLLEPRPRTLGAKLIEMARALQLEGRFDKDRILAMYLTLAPYGGNLSGVRAASRFYFGKEPGQLTDAEAALLVALPQSPERFRPDRDAARPRSARETRVLARARGGGLLSAAGRGRGRERAGARAAPAGRARCAASGRAAGGRGTRQQRDSRASSTAICSAGCRRWPQRQRIGAGAGATIAILVVENSGRGGARLCRLRRLSSTSASCGQNDMVQAIRSPGSTLKPFVYGLAFDDLLIHPETIVVDGPCASATTRRRISTIAFTAS